MMRVALSVIVLAAGLFATGCGTGVQIRSGMSYYQRGNYPAALATLQPLEGSEPRLNPKAQVRYLVYRGLAHYQLGQRQAALHYLSLGHCAYEQGNPRWLRPGAAAQMHHVLAELSRGPQAAVRPRPAPAMAPRVIVQETVIVPPTVVIIQ